MATEVSREPSSARSSAAHALPMSNIDWRRRNLSSRVVLCRGPRLLWERPESNTTRWAICGSSGNTSELVRLILASIAPRRVAFTFGRICEAFGRGNPSSRLAKSQVDALLAEQIMMCRLERLHAVIAQAIGAAPDHDVAVLERYAAGPVGPFQPAEQKNRRNAERDRDDRRTEVALVLVLMQRQPGAGQVLVDEARVGHKAVEAGERCGVVRKPQERGRHCRPLLAGLWIGCVVAIAGPVRDPAERTAVRQCHGHTITARRDHVTKRRLPEHFLQGCEHFRIRGGGKAAQPQRPGA